MSKEQYKRTFDVIKLDKEFAWDERPAKKKKEKLSVSKRALAVCVALTAAICGLSIAHAANIGGFRDVTNLDQQQI